MAFHIFNRNCTGMVEPYCLASGPVSLRHLKKSGLKNYYRVTEPYWH